ncbi:MAG: pyridoxal-dependent decarboxylase [Chloroflexota bacterium]
MTDADGVRPLDGLGDPGDLDAAQLAGSGDMPSEVFRAAAHAMADRMADYLRDVEGRAVLPAVRPGELSAALGGPVPAAPVPLDAILADVDALVTPNVTHWQHPGFFAYFPSSASGPGILGEMLMSTLVANAMLWRTSPVATELEGVVVGWLRDALGLPAAFDGLLTDTASTSSLTALAAARQAATGDAAAAGIAGTAPLRIYASTEAHSSIEKAAMTLGIGRAGVRRIATDGALAMDVAALEAAIAEDRAAGWRPAAIVATIGTTSSTAIDPVDAIADVAAREGLWLHVDAAYAGVVALIPERRAPFQGWQRADSIVVNPHKWLFTPLDCSLLLSRRLPVVRDAFSLVPEYLRTTGGASSGRDYNEYQPQLGRRFRALKLWMVLRYFGIDGLRSRIEEHIAMAARLADLIDADPDAERLAPAPFATVCFRWRPRRFAGREADPAVAARLDALNEAVMARVNDSGEAFLSHTKLGGRYTIRLAIGSPRTEWRHVARAWDLVRAAGAELDVDAVASAPGSPPSGG